MIPMVTYKRQRHVPLRSCVVCGQKIAKQELIRIVRTPAGRVEVDPTGKGAGRGAYLCKSGDCWSQNLKRSRLEYVLRGRISQEDWEALTSQSKGVTLVTI